MIRRDLLLTLFGIGAGQVILLLALPLLARAYGPGPFGAYSVIVSVAGIIATIAALRIDLAVSGAHDADVAPLTRGSMILPLVVVPAAIAVLAIILHSPLRRNMPFGVGDLPVIALIAFFQGLTLVGSGLSTRFGAFSTLAAIKIAQPLAFAATALLFLHDLPMAMAIGWIVALIVAMSSIRRVPFLRGWKATVEAIKEVWRFPAISAPMALLDVLTLSMPLLVIAAVFGEKTGGNYAQIQRLVGAPLVLVATAGGQTFLKHAGDRIRGGLPVMPLFSRFVLAMASLAFAVTVGVAIAGHPLLQLLFGPQWRTDTEFLILALLPILWRVIASPVASILILTHRIVTLGLWQITYFVVTTTVLLSAAATLSFEGVLAVLATSDFVMYGAYLFLSFRAVPKLVVP